MTVNIRFKTEIEMTETTLRKVAVVTGSQRGIGYEIVKGLARRWEGDVILCSLDEELGKEAVRKIQEEGITNVKLAYLSIQEIDSIIKLKDRLLKEYGGLDILVNNIGIAYVTEDSKPLIEIATETININVIGTISVCDILFPILRPGARVVNVSSSAGMLMRVPGEDLRKRLGANDLTRQDLEKLIEEYLTDVKEGRHKEKGWPYVGYSSYTTSKVFISALTWIQHRQFSQDTREDIVINAVHPGYCRTFMTDGQGIMTPEEGAQVSINCALIPANGQPRGQMVWPDGLGIKVVDWHHDVLSGGRSGD